MPTLGFTFAAPTDAHPSIQKILGYWIPQVVEDPVMQAFAVAIFEENNSRFGSLIRDILLSTKPIAASNNLIELWERAVDAPIGTVVQNLDLRRSNILSTTIHSHRMRTSDIANVVRSYLAGQITYTRRAVNNECEIPVQSVEGFNVGDNIFVGSVPRTIANIFPVTREICVGPSTPITTHAYELITTSLVQIEELYSSYTFNVIVEFEDVLNQTAMVNAIEAAKPAHLQANILAGAQDIFLLEDEDSLLESSKTFGPRILT
jgi:hypothetical protein